MDLRSVPDANAMFLRKSQKTPPFEEKSNASIFCDPLGTAGNRMDPSVPLPAFRFPPAPATSEIELHEKPSGTHAVARQRPLPVSGMARF